MTKILIAGEGGQGVQLIAEVLAKAAFKLNKYSLYIPNFGVEQRGGVSLAFVQIDNQPIPYPKFNTANFLVIMCERARQRVRPFVGKETQIISDLDQFEINLPQRVRNVFTLGFLLKRSSVLPFEPVEETLDEVLHKKLVDNPEIKKINFEALKAGFELNQGK